MTQAPPPNRAPEAKTLQAPRPHTKVVATIGPATEDRVEELIHAGMSVARLNFSHGEHDEHRRRAAKIREAAERLDAPVGILGDIQGPKMRLGRFAGGTQRLALGEHLRLVESSAVQEHGEIPVDVEGFASGIAIGQRVFLADGAVELVVEELDRDAAIAVVLRGGIIGDKKGVHLPDSDLRVELPTPKDLRDIELARELDVDMLGVSFVGSADDVRHVRALAPKIPIVAKIERLAALQEIRAILEEADGIMVARGDLGVEVALERLPMVQKDLIQEALRVGVFTITATEMLESMVTSSRPTRAEVADVANAILDGTDAVMLSAETAVGAYPIEAVEVMGRVASAVEGSEQYEKLPKVTFRDSEPTFSNAIALAAVRVADALSLSKIVCFTESGNTPRQISRYRPQAEIVALTPLVSTLRRMNALAHVRPYLVGRVDGLDAMIASASYFMLERGLSVMGEEVVFVAGIPPGTSRSTNLIKLHRVGEDVRI